MLCPRCNADNQDGTACCSECGAAQAEARTGYCTAPGYLILTALALASALVVGAAYHLLGRVADIFLVLAAAAGFALGLAISGGVVVARCRNAAFIAAAAVIAASLTYGIKTCLDGQFFVSAQLPRILARELGMPMKQARQTARKISAALGPIGSTKFYLDLQAETGVIVGKNPEERGAEMAGGVFWALMALETGVVALVAVGKSARAAAAPFCERCGEWRREAVLFRMSRDRFEPMLEGVMNQTWDKIAEMPAEARVNKRHCCEVVLATCPDCEDRTVILRVMDRGHEQRLWYASINVESADGLYRARQIHLSPGNGAGGKCIG